MDKPRILQLHPKLSLMSTHFRAVSILSKKNKSFSVIIHGTEGFEFVTLTTNTYTEADIEKSRIEKIVYDCTNGQTSFSY